MLGLTVIKPAWPKPLELLLRVVLAFCLVLWLAHTYGRALAEAVAPLFSSFLGALDNRLSITDLSVGYIGGDRKPSPDLLFRLEVEVVRPMVIGTKVMMPKAGGWLAASTTVGNFLQPIIMALGVLLAWPTRRLLEIPLRILFGVAFVALIVMLDIPLTLWAYIWERPIHYYDPERFSPLLIWGRFLLGGGRLVLGLLAATLTIALSNWIAWRIVFRNRVDSGAIKTSHSK